MQMVGFDVEPWWFRARSQSDSDMELFFSDPSFNCLKPKLEFLIQVHLVFD